MSRIGKLPIEIPGGVTVNVGDEKLITVKGPLGVLSQKVDPEIDVEIEGNQLLVKRPTDSKNHRAMHGLYRALLNNMVTEYQRDLK
jgi:large subunit ribosomal protein L6